MCWSETGCLNSIWKSAAAFFTPLSDPFLPHPSQLCVCVFVCWEVVKLRLRKASKFHSRSFDWLCCWTERFVPLLLMLCGCIENVTCVPNAASSRSSVIQCEWERLSQRVWEESGITLRYHKSKPSCVKRNGIKHQKCLHCIKPRHKTDTSHPSNAVKICKILVFICFTDQPDQTHIHC